MVTVTMLPFMYYKIHNKIQLAKNQCHTANISIERHVEAASCCYDGHQNGRGLYGCLPSNAGRSCNSLRRLRQARICRRISCGCVGGFNYPTKVRHFCDISKKIHDNLSYYLDLSGHKWTEVDNGSGNCRTFASSIRNDKQTGQYLLLSGGGFPNQRSSKRPPTPFRGRDKKTNLNQTQTWKRSGMIALTAGQRKNDTY